MSVAQLGPVYVPQNAQPPDIIPATPQAAATQARPIYAGFWLRAVAYLIDTVIVSVALALVGSFYPSKFIILPEASDTSQFALPHLTPLAIGITIPVIWLYYVFFETSSWQATPGKKALRLYVTDLNGRPITFARATIRHFGKMISGLTFLVGYALAGFTFGQTISGLTFLVGYGLSGFTEKKQALHDMLASCLVLRRP